MRIIVHVEGASGILRNSYESMFLKHIFKSLVGIVINPRLILKLLLKTITHKLNMKCDEIWDKYVVIKKYTFQMSSDYFTYGLLFYPR